MVKMADSRPEYDKHTIIQNLSLMQELTVNCEAQQQRVDEQDQTRTPVKKTKRVWKIANVLLIYCYCWPDVGLLTLFSKNRG